MRRRNEAVRNFYKIIQETLNDIDKASWDGKVFRVISPSLNDVPLPVCVFIHTSDAESSAFEGKAMNYHTFELALIGKDLNELTDVFDTILARLRRNYFVNDIFAEEGWNENIEAFNVTYNVGVRNGIRPSAT